MGSVVVKHSVLFLRDNSAAQFTPEENEAYKDEAADVKLQIAWLQRCWATFYCVFSTVPLGGKQSNFTRQQECIPVGCVPPAAVAFCWGSVCLSACWDTPPCVGLETPHQARPINLHPGCGPGDLQCMPGQPPCGHNSWHTLLKILPCSNFVAGDNNRIT